MKDLTWNFSKCLLNYCIPKEGGIVGILGHLSLQFIYLQFTLTHTCAYYPPRPNIKKGLISSQNLSQFWQ